MPSLEELARCTNLPIRSQSEPKGLVLDYRPENNGTIHLDIVDHPWPDGLGTHPGEEQWLASAQMGFFGPFATPGSLERACQQAWSWPAGAIATVTRHRSFVRIRLTYAGGASADQWLFPPGYHPQTEITDLSALLRRVVAAPGVLAYFNPNADLLLSPNQLTEYLSSPTISLPAWVNVRMFNLPESWVLMDTMGMAQFDLPDLQVCFEGAHLNPGEVAGRVIAFGEHLLQRGDVFAGGDTVDGPSGIVWRASRNKGCLVEPSRQVISFLPTEPVLLPAFLAALE